MVLYALVTVLENEKTEETFVNNSVVELQGVEDKDLVHEWIFEWVKSHNKDMRINILEELIEMNYKIYALKIEEPYATFFAFTDEKYPKSAANKCLKELQEKFLQKNGSKDFSNISEDTREAIQGQDQILTKYYDGNANFDQLNKQMNKLVNRAENNKVKTEELKDMTSQIKFSTGRMNKRASNINDSNAKCCRVF